MILVMLLFRSCIIEQRKLLAYFFFILSVLQALTQVSQTHEWTLVGIDKACLNKKET